MLAFWLWLFSVPSWTALSLPQKLLTLCGAHSVVHILSIILSIPGIRWFSFHVDSLPFGVWGPIITWFRRYLLQLVTLPLLIPILCWQGDGLFGIEWFLAASKTGAVIGGTVEGVGASAPGSVGASAAGVNATCANVNTTSSVGAECKVVKEVEVLTNADVVAWNKIAEQILNGNASTGSNGTGTGVAPGTGVSEAAAGPGAAGSDPTGEDAATASSGGAWNFPLLSSVSRIFLAIIFLKLTNEVAIRGFFRLWIKYNWGPSIFAAAELAAAEQAAQ